MKALNEHPTASWVSPKIEIRESRIHGCGMFATSPFGAGETVAIWGGTFVYRKAADRARAAGKLVMQLDDNLYSVEERGADETYFTNHSCDPNVWMMNAVTLGTRRCIPTGEELTVDYALFEAVGNFTNVGIYQRVFDDQAEPARRNDHREDVPGVFAGEPVMAVLERHKRDQDVLRAELGSAYVDRGFVFTRLDGRARTHGAPIGPNTLSRWFAEALRVAGLPALRVHDLRDTAATLAIAAGVDLVTVSEMLGHSSITMTADRYVHPHSTTKRDAADRLAGALAGNYEHSMSRPRRAGAV